MELTLTPCESWVSDAVPDQYAFDTQRSIHWIQTNQLENILSIKAIDGSSKLVYLVKNHFPKGQF